MLLRVLGPVEFDGASLGPKARALLCRLVVGSGRAVQASALIHAMWGDDAPRTAMKTLQGHVLGVRKALMASAGTEHLAIRFGGGGYVLVGSDPGVVDLTEFELLLAGVQVARNEGDRGAAAVKLRSALELWRGVPFGEFGDREWVTIERRRLEERCAAARED